MRILGIILIVAGLAVGRVVMRVYGPEGDILTGKWQQPVVRLAK